MNAPEHDPDVPIPSRVGGDVLLRVTLAMVGIGIGVWIVLAWTHHRGDYVGAQTAWHRGGRNLVEITLVREDEGKLACASDLAPGALACAFDGQRRARAPEPRDADRLRPYSTVGGDWLLGAGLWTSPRLARPLPSARFTVVCDLEVIDLVRSFSIRWAPEAPFEPSTKSIPAGRLHDCVIPP